MSALPVDLRRKMEAAAQLEEKLKDGPVIL